MRLWDSDRLYEHDGSGITSDYCRAACGQKRCDACPAPRLLPECQPGVAAYLACHTQWRTGGLGFRTGLDYSACIRTLELYLPRWQRDEDEPGAPMLWRALGVDDLLEDLAIIESAALTADIEQRERDKVSD